MKPFPAVYRIGVISQLIMLTLSIFALLAVGSELIAGYERYLVASRDAGQNVFRVWPSGPGSSLETAYRRLAAKMPAAREGSKQVFDSNTGGLRLEITPVDSDFFSIRNLRFANGDSRALRQSGDRLIGVVLGAEISRVLKASMGSDIEYMGKHLVVGGMSRFI